MSEKESNDILDWPYPISIDKLSDYQLIGFIEEEHYYAYKYRSVFYDEIIKRGVSKDEIESLKKQHRSKKENGKGKFSTIDWLTILGALLISGSLELLLKGVIGSMIIFFSVLFIWKSQNGDIPIVYFWNRLSRFILFLIAITLIGVYIYEGIF